MDHTEAVKQTVDVASVGVTLAVLLEVLPHTAAVLTVLWLGARLYNEIMTGVYRKREFQALKTRRKK